MSETTKPTKRRRRRAPRDYSTLPLIGYCRTSKDGGEKGASIADQTNQLQAWAAAQGVELIIGTDEGRSGSRADNRDGLQDALADIEAGRAGGIVAIDITRLARNVLDLAVLADRAQREGWRLISLDVGLDTKTPAGKMVQYMVAAAGEMHLGTITKRNLDTANHLRRQGRPRNQFPIAAPALADRIIAARDAGETYRAIADELMAEGILTARGGTTWHASSVKAAERARLLDLKAKAAA